MRNKILACLLILGVLAGNAMAAVSTNITEYATLVETNCGYVVSVIGSVATAAVVIFVILFAIRKIKKTLNAASG